MKALIQLFMAMHVGLYRLTSGSIGGSMGGMKVLLLTTTGRKTGKQRTLPLAFFQQPGGYLVVASNGGQPTNPAWYHNLTSNPQAQVELLAQTIPISAEVLSGASRAAAWQHVVAAAPAYARYETQTAREIPLVLLKPRS